MIAMGRVISMERTCGLTETHILSTLMTRLRVKFNTFFCLFITTSSIRVLVTICCHILVGHNKNASKNSSKSTYYGTDHGKEGGTQGRTSGVTFQRVSYGGINGPYYTASTRRTIGKDGVSKIFFSLYLPYTPFGIFKGIYT